VLEGRDRYATNLVLIDDPAFELLVKAIVTATLFNDVVDGKVPQTSVLCQSFTMGCFASARRSCDDNVWLRPHP